MSKYIVDGEVYVEHRFLKKNSENREWKIDNFTAGCTCGRRCRTI